MRINSISNYYQNNINKVEQRKTAITAPRITSDTDSFVQTSPAFKGGNLLYKVLPKYKPYREVEKYFKDKDNGTINKWYFSPEVIKSFDKKIAPILNVDVLELPQQFMNTLKSVLEGEISNNRRFASRFILAKYLKGNDSVTDSLQDSRLLEAANLLIAEASGDSDFSINKIGGERERLEALYCELAKKNDSLQSEVKQTGDLTKNSTESEVNIEKSANENSPSKECDSYNQQFWDSMVESQTSHIRMSEIFVKCSKIENFDINQIKFADGHNILTKLMALSFEDTDWAQPVMSLLSLFPNLDTNYCPVGDKHLLFKILEDLKAYYSDGTFYERYNDDDDDDEFGDVQVDVFKKLYEHPKTDRSIVNTNKYKRLLNSIKKNDETEELYTDLVRIMLNYEDKDYASKIMSVYNTEGTFTLNEMERIVSYKNFDNFANMTLNVFGERLGHMLAEIPIDKNDTEQVAKMEKIVALMYDSAYAFNATDDFGVTPLKKAINCENEVVINILRKYSAKV